QDVICDLAGRKFDTILLLGVMERVTDPAGLVEDCTALLKPHGLLVFAVPNVANISVRLPLLFGNFSYTEGGILDRTHLRFFTRRTIAHLVEKSGCSILRNQMTIIPLEHLTGLPFPNPLTRVIQASLALLTRLLPGLLGYQIYITA